MSDLPSRDLGYLAVVTEYFLGLRGAGLLVSPLDEELVSDWERRGLPVPVVCLGLRRGLEDLVQQRAPGAAPPRSIRALRFAVEDEWRAYRAGRVGDAPAPPAEADAAEARLGAARALLESAGRAAAGPFREGYRAAWRALTDASAHPGTPLDRVESAIAGADARILAAWLTSLSRPERAALGARLRLLSGARPPGASPRAHRDTLRGYLLDLARRAGLTCLRGSV
jgi:hypothetical protein